MGAENEFGISIPDLVGSRNPGAADSFLSQLFPERKISSNAIHRNQGRSYLELKTVEYATPECIEAYATALYETAGLSLLEDAADRYLQCSGTPIEFYKADRNCERKVSKGKAQAAKYGYGSSHANYLTFERMNMYFFAELLASFLLTRWAMIGNGWVDSDDDGNLVYLLSQRASITGAFLSDSSTAEGIAKPLISTRKQPLGDARVWHRFHDVSGNQNMSEWQLRLKYATMDLMLMMLEERGFLTLAPRIIDMGESVEQAVLQVREIATFFNTDLFGKTKKKLLDGSEQSALDIQRFFLDSAFRYFDEGHGPRTKERMWGLESWVFVLDALARKDLETLASYLDWAAILYHIVMPVLDRAGIDPEILLYQKSSPRSISCDHLIETKRGKERLLDYFQQVVVNYARVHVSKSPYGVLLKNGKMKKVFSSDEILCAKETPPPNTRAAFRGVLMNLPDREPGLSVQSWDWTYITMRKEWIRTVLNMNPYRACVRKSDYDVLYDRQRTALEPNPPVVSCSDSDD